MRKGLREVSDLSQMAQLGGGRSCSWSPEHSDHKAMVCTPTSALPNQRQEAYHDVGQLPPSLFTAHLLRVPGTSKVSPLERSQNNEDDERGHMI